MSATNSFFYLPSTHKGNTRLGPVFEKHSINGNRAYPDEGKNKLDFLIKIFECIELGLF
jgi:hypothetical protein